MSIILWLLLTGVAAVIAWYLQKILFVRIRPRDSMMRFVLFILLTFVSIFLIIVLYGYLLISWGRK